ncbi:molybdenum cofactor guanylyltransferase [Haloferax sp. DFSO52]|uniref:molybdenum cofactor guanylyltransferase n=1 Tax=Haloferax sp. DFSO52 TaxID=3388505 RepID=UPI003A888CEF
MGVSPDEVRGVVLAGGKSTRFGDQNKALARFDGDPLITHVVSTLRDVTGTAPMLAVSSSEHADDILELHPNVPSVSDDASFVGPIAGLFALAAEVRTPWVVVTGCDMPLVSQEAVLTLLDHATATVDAVVPTAGGHREPLFAAYRTASIRACRPEIPHDAGPQRLLDVLPTVRSLRTDSWPELATAVTNVNTQAELAALTEESIADNCIR